MRWRRNWASTCFYGGHYATETFGVKALAAELSKKFKVPWGFLDHPDRPLSFYFAALENFLWAAQPSRKPRKSEPNDFANSVFPVSLYWALLMMSWSKRP